MNFRFLREHFNIKQPLKKVYVTQPFGANDVPFYKTLGLLGHNGIDYRASVGTECYAVCDGVVTSAITDRTGGKALRYETESVNIGGIKYKLEILHYHLSEFKSKKNESVFEGEGVALTGNTGKYTSGPHLHFEIKPFWDEGRGWQKDSSNGYKGAVDPAIFFEDDWQESPVFKRYGRKKVWLAEFNMRFKNRWLHTQFYKVLHRHPTSITTEELNALVYGGWDFETVFLRPEMYPVWSEKTKTKYLK